MSKKRDESCDGMAISSNKSNSSDYYDEDDDSLDNVLNDFNRVFHDVPLIQDKLKKVKNSKRLEKAQEFVDNSKFVDAKTDEETDLKTTSSGFEEDEETHNDKLEKPKIESKSYIQKDSAYFQHLINDSEEINDYGIDLEFENYLNEENDLDRLVSEDSENFEKFQKEINSKIRRLEKVDFNSLTDLRRMAVGKYGLVNKRFRRKAWPLLISNRDNLLTKKTSGKKKISKKQDVNHLKEVDDELTFNLITEEQIKNNKYFNQVTLDVIRTLKRFPSEISDNLRFKLQNELIDLICRILVKHDNLHYYQGYHDICLTFLLVTGVEESLPLLESLTLSHLQCFMEPNMESTLKLLFNILPLVDIINPEMAEHIQKAELGVIFCLSWLITWYSHVMDNLQIVLRLYDFFIVSDTLMPVYLGAIIVSERAEEILNIDCDMASLHTVISKYPSQIENIALIEKYIAKTVKLFEKYPPNSLEKLNEKWTEKCKSIQIEKERLEEEYMNKLRRRRQNDDNEDNSDKAVAKRKNMFVTKHNNRPKKMANKLIMGFTVTVGVAAVAMYAMNNGPVKEPQEMFSKVFQLLTYKDFI